MRNLRVHTRLADLMRDLDGYLPAGGAPPGLSPSDAAVAVNCLHRLRERRPRAQHRGGPLERRYGEQLRALLGAAARGMDALDPWRIAMVLS